MPTRTPLPVVMEYTPTTRDEMQLSHGQFVTTLSHYFDGWAYGFNGTAYGVFPLSCVTPLQVWPEITVFYL